MKSIAATTLLCGLLTASEAFVVPTSTAQTTQSTRLFESTAEGTEDAYVNPANLANSNLPELKGDFDWDAKFGEDPDWITENVPGKVVLDEITLAKQVTSLNALEDRYLKIRQQQEIDEYPTIGWVGNAEQYNSRFAMFFLFVGLFTESFTGVTMPGQVEELLRITGVIGFN